MAHNRKIDVVTTYVTTDGSIFTVQETADAYELNYTKEKDSKKATEESISKLQKLADGYAGLNPYFYYLSRGGDYTQKRLGLKYNNTTALDVVKNLLITSTEVMEEIITQLNSAGPGKK